MKDIGLNGEFSNLKKGCHGNHTITDSQGQLLKWQPAYYFHFGRFILSDKSGCHLVLRKSPLCYIFPICLPTKYVTSSAKRYLIIPQNIYWGVYWNQPVSRSVCRAVGLSAKSCTFNSYSFNLNNLILAINGNQEQQMCKKQFLARRTESRGSYCRTPGVRRRRCQRQRQRPHLIKVSL